MRRYRPRAARTQYATPRTQNYGQRNIVQNPVFPAPTGVQRGMGRPLAERPANIRAEVEQRRRELQEKYRQDAAEAEEKRRRREQKKREEWLKRQEALVKPGYRLGYGTKPSNLTRDLIEHQDAVDCELQEPGNQELMDERIRMLVQQRVEREADALEVEREVKLLDEQARLQRLREERNMRQRQYPGSSNPRNVRQFFTSRTASSTSTANETGPANPRKQDNFMGVAQTASNASGPANPRKQGDFMSTAQTSSPASHASGPGNPRKPANFVGVPQSVPSTFNSNGSPNRRKHPVKFLGVAQSAPSSSLNTSCPESTKKPVNFLGVVQPAAPPSLNKNCPENTRKPANFLGVAQNASSPASITNNVAQEVSGHILGSGDNVAVVSENRETEIDHREHMRAARLRMQAQYNEEVRKAEQAKDQEVDDVAEGMQQISLK